MSRWFRNLFRPKQARKSPKRRTVRLELQRLEDRLTPSTLYVSDPGDSGLGTLRTQISKAQPGDTILFSSAIKGDPINLKTPITISLANLAIDGQNNNISLNGNNSTRFFEIAATGVIINNLTFAAGEATNSKGGAILVDNKASLTLVNDTFTGNKATGNGIGIGNGGAIENDGTLNIAGTSNFSNNQAGNLGGAIENTGTLNVTGATFTGNNATNASGAIDSNGGGAGSLTISTSTFKGNVSGFSGGAINTNDPTTLDQDTFGGPNVGDGNTTQLKGGAVYASNGTTNTLKLKVTNSTFTGNQATSATGQGGAIYSTFNTEVDGSTFTSNKSTQWGGALDYTIINTSGPAFDSVLKLFQDTFTGNSSQNGGAVDSFANVNSGLITLNVSDDTFASNKAVGGGRGEGGGMYLYQTTTGTGQVQSNLVNVTFFQNTSDNEGAGVSVYSRNTGSGSNWVALTSLTASQNTAANGGGALMINAVLANTVSVENSILDNNTVTNEPGLPQDVTAMLTNTLNDIGWNLVGTTDSMFDPTNKHDILNNNSGLDNKLANNGAQAGYPQTLALLPGSVAIGAGEDRLSGLAAPYNQDARGLTRQPMKGGKVLVSIGAEDPNAM